VPSDEIDFREEAQLEITRHRLWWHGVVEKGARVWSDVVATAHRDVRGEVRDWTRLSSVCPAYVVCR
jgi:hypothetical protein